MTNAILRLVGITKRFGAKRVLDDIDIAVREGELVAFMGPSGCGKTTLLRIIGGFVPADGGRVELDGQTIDDRPPHARPTAMVFQNGALFPHLNVGENVGYGLRLHKLPRQEIALRVKNLLALVQLDGMEREPIGHLSGGQQQRVALARAFSLEPRVLLLDEPYSALDANLRHSMREELRRLQRQLGITTILVTHDQYEAMTVSDRIVVLDQGRVQQIGTPSDIYEQPCNAFVAEFVGGTNFLDGTVTSEDGDRYGLDSPLGPLRVHRHGRDFRPGQAVKIGIRSEAITLVPASSPNGLRGRIEMAMYAGPRIEYLVRVGAVMLEVSVANPGKAILLEGEIGLVLPNSVLLLPQSSK